MRTDPLAIAQVLPFALEDADPVGIDSDRLCAELRAGGHAVVTIAPSRSATLVRDSRRAIRAARDHPTELLDRSRGESVTLAVGEVLPFGPGRRRAASVPVDVARTIEDVLTSVPFDVVHLHDPFAPSASSAALRHSRALNVATFHEPTERELSRQLTRPLTRLLFGRLDARTVGSAAAGEMMARYLPGSYEVVIPGAEPPPGDRSRLACAPPEIVLIAGEERAALRVFVRALRTLGTDEEWSATIFSPRPAAPPANLGRLRDRIRVLGPGEASEPEILAGAEIAVLASEGARPRPGLLGRMIAAGAVPVVSRLAPYEELTGEGAHGLVFEPGDAETLAAHLRKLLGDPALRASMREAAAPLRVELSWTQVAARFEAIYERLAARRRRPASHAPGVTARLRERPLIDVDLHMHTDHSYDCATPVEVLLAEARSVGLGAIAVTDHNEISGALEARAKADGLKVIVGEEVKTADQGEVIGLFLERRIPKGMTLQATIAEIRRQGGVVYVPHPFDRLHAVPDYEHLMDVLDQVDAIEVFNPRVAISEFNEEAVRFAAKYRIPAGAGSDAHVPQGLGSVRIRMRDFDGAEDFLDSLREADIIRNPASLLYVQALKFLQTKALPSGARRSARDRRVRRAARKS